MKRYLTITAAVAAVTLTGLGLAGCGDGGTPGSAESSGSPSGSGSSAPAGTIRLAGVSPMATDPFYISLMCGADKAAAGLGASIEWKSGNNTDVSAMAANIDAAQLTDPDALITVGLGDSSMNSAIQKAMTAGIPVVTAANPNVPAVEYALVSSNTDSSSFADYVAGDVGSSGSFAVLGAIAGADLFAMRYQPVIDAIAQRSPDVKILPVQYTDMDRTKAASTTSALIAGNPDLVAIFTTTSHEAVGAASALREAGKAGSIKIYTFDATPEVIQGIKDGSISAALSQAPAVLGQKAVERAVDYVTSGKTGPVAPDPSLDETIDLKILTADNIGDADTQDYQYTSTCQ